MGTTNFGSELSALLAGSTPTSSSTLSQILQVSYYSTSVSFIPVESPATRTIATTVVLTSTRPGTTVVAGQQTEFVPLTTFFTAPTDCNAPTAHSQSANATSIAVTTSCYPPSWPSYQQSSVGFYSPGVCPAAFEWADVSAAIIAPGEAAETRAICCPRGMSSTAVHDATIYCHDGPTLGAAAGGRFALPVSVAWRADDQELFSPPYAPVAALGSNGYNVSFLDTPEPSSRPAGDTSSASPRSSGGFSTGAIAGTAAGVAVVVLAALAVLWWYIRRRRRRSRQPSASTRDGVGETAGVDVLPLRTEKDGDERFEIGDTAKPNEAGGTSIAELDGGWQAAEVDAKGPRAGA